jgi:hypothetical protein
MKNKLYIFFLLVVTTFFCCKKETAFYDLGVDLQGWFAQDHVQVILDTKQEFNKQITTNPSLGYADGFLANKNEGIHIVKIIVNNNIIKSETFSLSGTLYMGVGFDRQSNQISLHYSKNRFAYD